VFSAPGDGNRRRSVDSVPGVGSAAAHDSHVRGNDRSADWPPHDRPGLHISIAWGGIRRHSRTRTSRRPTATVEYFLDRASKGTFPFYRGARPNITIGNALVMADIVESSYHPSYCRRTGGSATACYSTRTTRCQGRTIPVRTRRRSFHSFATIDRFVTSFHYAPDFLYGVQIGGTATFESGSGPRSTAAANGDSSRAPLSGVRTLSTAVGNETGPRQRQPADPQDSRPVVLASDPIYMITFI
jgi:hypothetical protein